MFNKIGHQHKIIKAIEITLFINFVMIAFQVKQGIHSVDSLDLHHRCANGKGDCLFNKVMHK